MGQWQDNENEVERAGLKAFRDFEFMGIKDEYFDDEKTDGPSMQLNTPCQSCLKDNKGICYTVTKRGVQKGISFDLNLYDCIRCKTTRAEKINKQQGEK